MTQQPAEEMVTYSLLVSNVGWVYRNEPDYERVLADYVSYSASTCYSQVSLWASDEEDPIREFELEKEYPEGYPEQAGNEEEGVEL